MRTVATFVSAAFDTSTPKADHIEPALRGDAVAHWLIARLRAARLSTDPAPGQEDFGWYFNFAVPGGSHTCLVALRPGYSGAAPEWVISIERQRGFLFSVLGGRNRGIAPRAVALVHDILAGSPEITRLRWHDRRSFAADPDDAGTSRP